MPAQTWLERMEEMLRDQGVPEREQQRFLEELRDHWQDAQEAKMNEPKANGIEQTLGAPEPLAQELASAYRQERLLARHPWLAGLAFAIGPVVAHWVLTMTLSSIGMCFIHGLTQTPERPDSEVAVASLPILFGGLGVIVGLGVTAWFCLAARRNRLSWMHSLVSSLALTSATPLLLSAMMPSTLALVGATGLMLLATFYTWRQFAWRNGCWKEKPISLSRQHPVLVSSFGGLTIAILCLLIYLVVFSMTFGALETLLDDSMLLSEFTPLIWSCRFVPFAAAAYLCWRMTARCPRQTFHSLLACVCVGLIAGMFFMSITAGAPAGENRLTFGVGFGGQWNWLVVFQVLTPLAVWSMLHWRQRAVSWAV